MDQKTRCMSFLYKWVTKGHLSNLRKGMVEELEAFVAEEISTREIHRMAVQMQAQQEKTIVDSVSQEFDKESK